MKSTRLVAQVVSIAMACVAAALPCAAQNMGTNNNPLLYLDPAQPAEKRAEDLLSKMTLEEKIDYIGGMDGFYIRAIERLETPPSKCRTARWAAAMTG